MKLPRWWAFAGLLFVGCQFSASCGAKKIDQTKAKDFVSSNLESSQGIKPSSVSCPEDVKLAKDATFECDVDFGAVKGKVVIKQLDDQANVQIDGSKGIVFMKLAEAQIGKGIGEQTGLFATVDCGPDRVRAATGTFECKASAKDGSTAIVKVTVKDETGAVGWEMQGGAPPPPATE